MRMPSKWAFHFNLSVDTRVMCQNVCKINRLLSSSGLSPPQLQCLPSGGCNLTISYKSSSQDIISPSPLPSPGNLHPIKQQNGVRMISSAVDWINHRTSQIVALKKTWSHPYEWPLQRYVLIPIWCIHEQGKSLPKVLKYIWLYWYILY